MKEDLSELSEDAVRSLLGWVMYIGHKCHGTNGTIVPLEALDTPPPVEVTFEIISNCSDEDPHSNPLDLTPNAISLSFEKVDMEEILPGV